MAAVLRSGRQREMGEKREEKNALDLGRQTNGILVELRTELVNQVELPVQPLDLPDTETEGEERHDPYEDQEGPPS